ncbi:hypothetical protein [Paenibacillus solani]|uniref:hypothetical protein n=1 Tax=Paenibacillus solani TaxID=1705565 RepID=UPI003D29E37D
MNMGVNDEYRHLTERYIRGEGTDEERSNYEELMLSDDSVLTLYMQVLAEFESELPNLPDPEAFADELVAHEQIKPYVHRTTLRNQDHPKRWYERAIVHYTIAASITMLFLFTGAFNQLLPGETSRDISLSNTPSYSEHWMEKTTGWLDQLLSRTNE